MDLSESHRKRLFRQRLVRYISLLAVMILVIWGLSPWMKLSFNMSESLDGYLFVILKNVEIRRGDQFAFHPPENRFFKNTWFVKIAAGVEGDLVAVKDLSFFINDQYVGDAKTQTMNGDRLFPSSPGYIPAGYYFAWTPHKHSFDSRYEDIGWINKDRIIGRAYRIF